MSDLFVEPLRSFEIVALALSVAPAKAKENSAGSKGIDAIASSASPISVGFTVWPSSCLSRSVGTAAGTVPLRRSRAVEGEGWSGQVKNDFKNSGLCCEVFI